MTADAGYVCGSADNAGRCATCPPWCRGRKEFDRTTPRWQATLPNDRKGSPT